ncbi:uncharacterized protein [Prorops nasuta]|uniref:uncharacterized protein n=1 Tax=Prorops nasuta TaxID=863751 RepID=UPI0034CDB5BF
MILRQFKELVEMAIPYLRKKSPRALHPELRLIIALRYLATGDTPLTIGLSFRVGESTVRSVVKEVCSILIKVLQPRYLPSLKEDDWKKIAKGYWSKWNLPNCVGAIDGKHIRIRCPPNSGSLYFNYKKYYSIVLMAIADHEYRFVLVDVGAYGGNSDGGIFNECNIGINLSNDDLNLPQNKIKLPNSNLETYCYFISDDAFRLSKRVLKPYSSTNLSYKKRIFDYRLSRARRIVESTFGIFANKWRIFHTTLSMLPETVDILVFACVCLHNFILRDEDTSEFTSYNTEVIDTSDNTDFLSTDIPTSNNLQNESLCGENQREILSNYFVSPAGQVPWQNDYIQCGKYRDE